MSALPFADAFMTGAVLTIVLPIGLVLAIFLWYSLAYRRVPSAGKGAAALPSEEMVKAAGPDVVSDATLDRHVTPVDEPADRT